MKMKFRKSSIIALAISFLCFSVAIIYAFLNKNYLPKPYGFRRIVLPQHEYVPLERKYPYLFQISKHAIVIDESTSEYGPHCITIQYPDFDAEIQITYKNFKGKKSDLRKLIRTSKSLAYRHQVKAYEIKENLVELENGMLVAITELAGSVPTQMQFYTTDMKNHFIRGALYFKTSTQNDYLEPVINFIKEDILHMIKTFEWQDEQSKQNCSKTDNKK